MDFRTKVPLTWSGDKISHSDSILFIGSCFADEIGCMFSDNKFKASVNPFGVLYNPLSIAKSLERAIHCLPYSDDELFKHSNLYHSFDHHSSFSDTVKERMLSKINTGLDECNKHLKEAAYIFITFGTSWVYELKDDNKVVSNCHKLPSSYFIRRRAGIDEMVERMKNCIEKILEFNCGIKGIVVTVSPIRHLRDGAHENNLSKSALLLMCDSLQSMFPKHIKYLPTYEIILDELRDYRFYANDMVHPSDRAVEYIWESIKDVAVSPESNSVIKEWSKIKSGLNHRLMSADTEGYKVFLKNLLGLATDFASRYPDIDITSEIRHIENKISKEI